MSKAGAASADLRGGELSVAAMALVVFIAGSECRGHRRLRPSLLARELVDYQVVNIGAAGTFVARAPGAKDRFRAALAAKLPFTTGIAICEDEEILALVRSDPFRGMAALPIPYRL